MDYSVQYRREASGELTLKPSPGAVALATAYRKNPTPGCSWPAARVKEEAIACVAAAGGDVSNRQLVLSESALQFGQYRGKSFKWLLSNDVGYAPMVLAMHQREHEGGDTTQSAVMSLLLYAGLFPDMVAAISERRVREGTGTPVQEDLVLVGFGNFATVSFKDLYEAMDLDRKGFIKWVRKQTARPGTKMETLQKYIQRRDAEMLSESAPPVVASISASAEEPSDEDLLAAAAHIDVPADVTQPSSQPEPLPSATRAAAPEPLPTEELLLPEGWRQTLPKEQHLWVSKALFTRDKSGRLALTKNLHLWWHPPGPCPLYTQPPSSPDSFYHSQQLLGLKLAQDYTSPSEYTGELFGVEYLYSQTSRAFEEDLGVDPDIPDGIQDEDLQGDLEGDEGFEDLCLDEPIEFLELEGNDLQPPQEQTVALQPPGQPSSSAAESSSPVLATQSQMKSVGPDGQAGYDQVIRLADSLVDLRH